MTNIHRPTLAAPGAALATAAAIGLLACSDTPRGEPASPGASDSGSEVAAEVNGEPITLVELDEWIKEDLFRSRAENPSGLYELRQQGLERILEERVLEIEARRRGVDVDELLTQQVASLGPVTDAEVESFYAENRQRLGGAELEEVRERIRQFLGARRDADARRQLVESAEIVVHLEPPRVRVAANGPSKGPADAQVTIVEFSDFQCPFCRRVMATLDEVLERYPDDVRVVYRHFPLASHSRARPAAEAALCAADQEKFWPYHDLLFANARQLSDEDLLAYAEQVGLDSEAFQQCYDAKRFAAKVDADLAEGKAAGVTGTPAFFVNGVLLSGAKPAEDFFRVIDAELRREPGA